MSSVITWCQDLYERVCRTLSINLTRQPTSVVERRSIVACVPLSPGETKRERRGTITSDSLLDTPVHKVQASAAALVRSNSLENLSAKEKGEQPQWLNGYQGDGTSPGDLMDSPRHKVQAAAAKIVRSHSLEALDSFKQKGNAKKSPQAVKVATPPRPCFEFENFSDSEAKEEDIDEIHGTLVPPSPQKWTLWDSAKHLILRPFKRYESKPSLIAVRGRVRSESDIPNLAFSCKKCDKGSPCPPCESFGLKAKKELRHEDLLCCGAFELIPEANLTAAESYAKRKESLKDPAILVGYQICLLKAEEVTQGEDGAEALDQYDIDGVDEQVQPLSERLRVVVAYQKETDKSLLRRSSKYLLMKGDGTVDWLELKRGALKRGLPFTALRRICN